MLLYDSQDVKSKESRALDSVALFLSHCPSMQELTETNDQDEACAFIHSGPTEDPLDSDQFTEEELAKIFFLGIVDSDDTEGHVVDRDNSATLACPLVTGTATIYLRRYVRAFEVAENQTDDVYRFFRDRVGATMVELLDITQDSNEVWIESLVRTIGPVFADLAEEVGQGSYIWCVYQFDWGYPGDQ